MHSARGGMSAPEPAAPELTAPKLTAAELTGAGWVKSTRSGPTGGNCVEVASLDGGQVAVRNSRHPSGPALVFAAAEWDAFVERMRSA